MTPFITLAVFLILYFLPSINARSRHHNNAAAICMLNFFLGWTGLGWIAAIVWSPYVGHFESIFQGITAIICYIAPPITAVFVAGVFWRKASGVAAFTTLLSGSVMGFVVFILDWNKEKTGWGVPPMMATFYLFVICMIIMVVVSLLKPHRHTAESAALVWRSPLDALRGESWTGIGNYRVLSAALVVTMIALYVVFS